MAHETGKVNPYKHLIHQAERALKNKNLNKQEKRELRAEVRDLERDFNVAMAGGKLTEGEKKRLKTEATAVGDLVHHSLTDDDTKTPKSQGLSSRFNLKHDTRLHGQDERIEDHSSKLTDDEKAKLDRLERRYKRAWEQAVQDKTISKKEQRQLINLLNARRDLLLEYTHNDENAPPSLPPGPPVPEPFPPL